MPMLRATHLFQTAAEAVEEGRCEKAKSLYRKGLAAQRKALKAGGGAVRYRKMFDARFVARTLLRRGCSYMLFGRRR